MTELGEVADARSLSFDNRIHLFYDFMFDSPTVIDKLSNLTVSRCAPEGLVHATRIDGSSQRTIADKPVWEVAPWDISIDLHPFVRELLDSRDGLADRPHCLRLSIYGKNLLTGRYRTALPQEPVRGRRPPAQGFDLELSTISTRTIGFQALPLALDDVSVHVFGTGFGMAVATLRLELSDPSMAAKALVEGLPRLCDERGVTFLHWRAASGDVGAASAFSLSSGVAATIEPAGCAMAKRDRVYSYCTLVFGGKVAEPEKRDLAFRLSRHYNSRYRPSPEHTGTYFACPFETVLHAMSREGVCTIVDFVNDEAQPIEFLGTWLAQAHPRVYLPLQIAAYHEHVVLMDLAQGAGRPIDVVRSAAKDIEALRTLSARFLLFRLRYRLSQVSRLTTHDIAYAATEQALGLSGLSDKIGRDLLAVEGRLIDFATKKAEYAAKRVERLWALPVTVGSVALAFVSINSFDDAVKRFYAEIFPREALPRPVAIAIDVIIVAILVAVFAYRWSWKRAGSGDMDRVFDREAARASLVVAE